MILLSATGSTRAYISGLVTPLVLRAQSRYVLQAIKIDSVPPEVAAVSSAHTPTTYLCLRRSVHGSCIDKTKHVKADK